MLSLHSGSIMELFVKPSPQVPKAHTCRHVPLVNGYRPIHVMISSPQDVVTLLAQICRPDFKTVDISLYM